MCDQPDMISTTNQCDDINDVFNDIAFSEQRIVQEGFREGLKKGLKEGEEEGYHVGFHEGVVSGHELGYYEGVVNHLLRSHETKSVELSEKVVNILLKLKSLIGNYPEKYELQSRNEIKSLFRRLCSLLKFDALPVETSVSF